MIPFSHKINIYLKEDEISINFTTFKKSYTEDIVNYILIDYITLNRFTTIERKDPNFFYYLEKCLPYLIVYYPHVLKDIVSYIKDAECRDFIISKLSKMQNTEYKFKYITYMDNKTGENKVGVVENFSKKSINKVKLILPYMNELYLMAKNFLEDNINDRYKTFFKEKRSGGKRRIDIPDNELKAFMRAVNYFINNICYINFPSNVFGFIKNKSTKMLAEVHNNLSSMIEVDIKDFFPNCTLDKLMYSMKTIYPFCLMDSDKLEVILKACMIKYDGKYRLPQGAPTSPVLSNILMLPIDFILINNLEFKSRLANKYTRYADNIYVSRTGYLYSAKSYFIWKAISNALYAFDFDISSKKSGIYRFTKTNRIYITGIMINKRREITIGHTSKQYLKSYIFNILMDAKNNKARDKKQLQSILGKIGYFRYIEPDFVDKVIEKYEQKTGMNYKNSIKKLLYS